MSNAAREGDAHTCPLHGGGVVSRGEPTVTIGGKPAARMLDPLGCGAPNAISAGSPTVLIGIMPAARQGDPTAHGGVVSQGEPSVTIGATPVAAAMVEAAAHGHPVVETNID